MVYTRTHTRYFAEDHIEELRQIASAMTRDLNSRAPAIDSDLLRASTNRLSALNAAIEICAEEAD